MIPRVGDRCQREERRGSASAARPPRGGARRPPGRAAPPGQLPPGGAAGGRAAAAKRDPAQRAVRRDALGIRRCCGLPVGSFRLRTDATPCRPGVALRSVRAASRSVSPGCRPEQAVGPLNGEERGPGQFRTDVVRATHQNGSDGATLRAQSTWVHRWQPAPSTPQLVDFKPYVAPKVARSKGSPPALRRPVSVGTRVAMQ